jgi:glycosyltransferase involved in cell wall biosynthesis
VPPKEGAQPLILFLGRLYPEKGADVLIRAIRGRTERRSAPPATCLIAGDGPERPRLEALAAGHPVEFAGFVDGAAKADLLARATAVVVPSRWYENAPMAILEAFAAGTPVVASRIGGIPEMVRDGVEGLLVEPGDAGDLARALDRLLGDATLRRRLGRQARETAARAHAPERYVADLERVYRDAGAGER